MDVKWIKVEFIRRRSCVIYLISIIISQTLQISLSNDMNSVGATVDWVCFSYNTFSLVCVSVDTVSFSIWFLSVLDLYFVNFVYILLVTFWFSLTVYNFKCHQMWHFIINYFVSHYENFKNRLKWIHWKTMLPIQEGSVK